MTRRTMALVSRRSAGSGEVMDDAQAEYTWFYRTEFRAVVQTAYLVLHDRQQAEDVAQEAFTQLLLHWRKISRYERPDAAIPVRDLDLIRALRELPPQQRAAIALYYSEDRPTAEVAHILGCTAATIVQVPAETHNLSVIQCAFELRRTWLDDPNAAVDTGSCGADLSVSFTE